MALAPGVGNSCGAVVWLKEAAWLLGGTSGETYLDDVRERQVIQGPDILRCVAERQVCRVPGTWILLN